MSKTYRVTGMTCSGCARSVEAAIRAVAPDARVQVDVASGRVTVDGVSDDAVVQAAVDDAGFSYEGTA